MTKTKNIKHITSSDNKNIKTKEKKPGKFNNIQKGEKTETPTCHTTLVVCYFAHSKNRDQNMPHHAD
jgi:hypothetical protein